MKISNKEKLANLIKNRSAGVMYVASFNGGCDSVNFMEVRVKQYQGQTEDDYVREEEAMIKMLQKNCVVLYKVTRKGMKRIWQDTK